MKRMSFLLAIASIATIGSAQAQTIGTATTDLNIRSGPGPDQPVVGHIRGRQSANILGCIDGSLWCRVEFRGVNGWAYSRYMTLNAGGRRLSVTEPANVRVAPMVTYQPPADSPGAPIVTYRSPVGETTGAAPFVASGTLIAPPEGAVFATTPAAIAPPPAIGSYVATNPGDPVTLEGEVVVGAALPRDVTLNRLPDYRYRYVYVNETPVLVDPATRRIVYVFR